MQLRLIPNSIVVFLRFQLLSASRTLSIIVAALCICMVSTSQWGMALAAEDSSSVPNLEDAALQIRWLSVEPFSTGSKTVFEVTNESRVSIQDGAVIISFLDGAGKITAQSHL